MEELNLGSGRIWEMAKPAEVIDFLRGRELSICELPPERIRVIAGGSGLVLQTVNGVVREYPLRESCFWKISRWLGAPPRLMERLSPDTVAMVLNDALAHIKAPVVRLKIEDGEALTLLGPLYNEFTDLDAIELSRDLGITSISRTDRGMRIYSDITMEVRPVPEDLCGLGFNVMNSETGFHALSVTHYLIRYICSNGAVIRVGPARERRIHYGSEHGALHDFFNRKRDEIRNSRGEVGRALAASVNAVMSVNEVETLSKDFRRLTGRVIPKAALDPRADRVTRYEAFNYMTHAAKEHSPWQRAKIEMFAGTFLLGGRLEEYTTEEDTE